MKTIDNCFRRSFLHIVGRVTSLPLGEVQLIDHTTGVGDEACRGGGLTISDSTAELEPLYEDYALTTFVWSQQTANAEQVEP